MIVLLGLFIAAQTTPVKAIYNPLSTVNNRFGIHILDTSETEKAAELVNSGGGDWGYVTIPIRANDRDLVKWTKFMTDSSRLHLIPILRIASFPVDDHWMAPNEWDIIDFVNFMDNLPWPVKNRYIIVYNEPNHKNEWGGFVYPEEYSRVLSRAIDIFHKRNPDYFIISAGLDSSAPDGSDSMNEYEYMQIMNKTVPGIFQQIDGFSVHAYGNPGFSSFPNVYSQVSVTNFRFEEQYLSSIGVGKPKLFLTEAGWNIQATGEAAAKNFYRQAFQYIWTDDNIVAITPFVLDGGAGPFAGFSFVDSNGQFKQFAQEIKSLPKEAGKPQMAEYINKPSMVNQGNSGLVDQDNGFLVIIQKILKLFRI